MSPTPNPTHANSPQIRRAMQALHVATWFALCQGDRYSALGRKSVANSFYNLLPMLAEVRKAVMGDADAGGETVEVIEAASGGAIGAGAAAADPRRLHAVGEPAQPAAGHAAGDAAAAGVPAPAPLAARGD